MKQEFVYSEYTNTIRLMPQNYCVMTKYGGAWVLDPDGALSTYFCCRVVKCITGPLRMDKFLSGADMVKILNKSVSLETVTWYAN